MKSEGVGLIVRAISFQDFQIPTYVILIHQHYRQRDRRTTCNGNTALRTIVRNVSYFSAKWANKCRTFNSM